MSYGIMPYRVSLSRLQTRFGNPDKAKRRKTRDACVRYAREIDELDSAPDAPTFMQVVDDLLDGKVEHPNYGHKYWYALKGFIESIGKFLNNNYWYPASADVFWDIDAFKLYDIDAPMKIPSPADFPTVFVLRGDRMTDKLLKELEEKIEDREQFLQVAAWIKEAKRYKQDLVLFYH
jgi:hypothetical protein